MNMTCILLYTRRDQCLLTIPYSLLTKVLWYWLFLYIFTIKLFIKKKRLHLNCFFSLPCLYKHTLPIITCARGYQVLFALENMYQVAYIFIYYVHTQVQRTFCRVVYLKICLIFFSHRAFIFYLFLCWATYWYPISGNIAI